MGEAALATGLRMQLATEILDVDKNLVPGGDYTRYSIVGKNFAKRGRVANRWHGQNDGLITARLGPHAIDTVSEGLFRECVQEARARMGFAHPCSAVTSRS